MSRVAFSLLFELSFLFDESGEAIISREKKAHKCEPRGEKEANDSKQIVAGVPMKFKRMTIFPKIERSLENVKSLKTTSLPGFLKLLF